jgi:hypothetical protein
VLLLYLLLDEIIDILIALVSPIADLFPRGLFDKIELPGLIVLVLLLGASFLFGLALRSDTLRSEVKDDVLRAELFYASIARKL